MRDEELAATVEESARRGLARWGAPGMAVAVVQGGLVTLAEGFGVRRASSRTRVDADTRWQLASCGKAFTASALALLADRGRIDWDDRVMEHLPDFRLADPRRTARVTVRDLLSHRTGLPGGDLLWASAQFDRAEILRRLRCLRPIHRLREAFVYQNLMYVVAGEIVGAASGEGYDAFVRRRLLDPLGMRSSLTNTSALTRASNVADPHALVGRRAIPVARWEDPIGSGDGSILSTAGDMGRWLRFLLGEGTVGSRRLLRGPTFREMLRPHITIRADRWELGILRALGMRRPALAYGMGWFLMDLDGLRIAWHSGGIDGMSAEVAFVPDRGVGVAALTNAEGISLPQAVALGAIDACLGRKGPDWIEFLHALDARRKARARRALRRKESARPRARRPAAPLFAYAGRYEDPYHGTVVVELRAGRLRLRFGRAFMGPLVPWGRDAFRFRSLRHPGASPGWALFSRDRSGRGTRLRLELEGADPARFRREA